MKKIAIFLLIIVSIIPCLSGCVFLQTVTHIRAEFPLMHSENEISRVEIVEVVINADEWIRNTEPDQKVVATIEDIGMFLDDFRSVSAYYQVLGEEPFGVSVSCVALKVIYKNGDYDLIDYTCQSYYLSESKRYCAGTHVRFDEEEFFALLSKHAGYDVVSPEF